jgi:H/ACA ribonucleoprotein complex subunit 4
VTLQDLKDAWMYWLEDKDDTLLRKYLKPMEILLQPLPKIVIHDSAVDAICHGADLAIPGMIKFEDIKGINEQVAIITRKGEGVALGESLMDTKQILREKSGFAIKTSRVLMETGKYEKGWKKAE